MVHHLSFRLMYNYFSEIIDRINEVPQPAEVLAVEIDDEPRHGYYVCVI